ncbi:hypothetical protein MVEN_02402400 [Mycena venus]|uniref:Uncharacterized protein n=1 Tax=Mycena venus TaxID=2733690 RepID=A0A8H7CD96_9AGAR|nr:hypothetical protein MVEN_02402400 [Mycena venus]
MSTALGPCRSFSPEYPFVSRRHPLYRVPSHLTSSPTRFMTSLVSHSPVDEFSPPPVTKKGKREGCRAMTTIARLCRTLLSRCICVARPQPAAFPLLRLDIVTYQSTLSFFPTRICNLPAKLWPLAARTVLPSHQRQYACRGAVQVLALLDFGSLLASPFTHPPLVHRVVFSFAPPSPLTPLGFLAHFGCCCIWQLMAFSQRRRCFRASRVLSSPSRRAGGEALKQPGSLSAYLRHGVDHHPHKDDLKATQGMAVAAPAPRFSLPARFPARGGLFGSGRAPGSLSAHLYRAVDPHPHKHDLKAMQRIEGGDRSSPASPPQRFSVDIIMIISGTQRARETVLCVRGEYVRWTDFSHRSFHLQCLAFTAFLARSSFGGCFTSAITDTPRASRRRCGFLFCSALRA